MSRVLLFASLRNDSRMVVRVRLVTPFVFRSSSFAVMVYFWLSVVENIGGLLELIVTGILAATIVGSGCSASDGIDCVQTFDVG